MAWWRERYVQRCCGRLSNVQRRRAEVKLELRMSVHALARWQMKGWWNVWRGFLRHVRQLLTLLVIIKTTANIYLSWRIPTTCQMSRCSAAWQSRMQRSMPISDNYLPHAPQIHPAAAWHMPRSLLQARPAGRSARRMLTWTAGMARVKQAQETSSRECLEHVLRHR